MKQTLIVTAVAVTLALGSARGNDAILDLLIKKGVITQREANEVREQADQQMAQTVEAYNKGKYSSWLDNVKLSGDLRLRAENFSFEDYRNTTDRLRFRYRLRLGMEYNYHDWAKLTVRLGSGNNEPAAAIDTGDPVSTNATMTDTFRKKSLYVDAVYVTLQPPGWNWVKVLAGKMDTPVWQPKFNSPMVYDFDVTPEGVAEQLEYVFGDKQQYRLFGLFGQYALKEISGNSRDPFMVDLQGGIEAKFGGNEKNPKLKTTLAGGYYFTHNLENGSYTMTDSPNLGNANGSGAKSNNWLSGFSVAYGRGEVAYNITDKPFLGTPALLTLSGEVDKNLNGDYEHLPDNQTLGWTVQLAFGDTKKKGQWQIAYQYKHLEADAVWDAITDSDWGVGGTDREGHVIKGAYCVTDWWQFACTAFFSEKISNRPNTGHNTVGAIGAYHGQDLLRLQVDSVFKF